MNFYSQDLSSFPSPFLSWKVCISLLPRSQTKQDGSNVGGGWRWCLRVIDVDVCWNGTDEPNQFPT